ncbi:hypothetical protein ACFL6C_08195 [Myxococcota bacterium]
MSRPIDHGATLCVNLGPVERTIVGYYGHRFGGSKGAIIRGLIRAVCQHDKDLRPQLLLEFARQDLPRIEDLDEQKAIGITKAVEMFAESMYLAEPARSDDGDSSGG